MNETPSHSTLQVKVRFPISHKGPFETQADRETLVGAIRTQAMAHFEVQEDSQTKYVLAHDGEEEADNRTLGEVAAHAHAINFSLIKQISQG